MPESHVPALFFIQCTLTSARTTILSCVNINYGNEDLPCMVSERSYWIILIAALGLFMTVDLFWVRDRLTQDLPGFGLDLWTNALFTVFTIVFLTWGINIREEKRWRIVGSKIQERIEYRLQKILTDIFAYFLEPEPELIDEVDKKLTETDKVSDRTKKEKAMALCLAKHYAEQDKLQLGQFVKAFLEKPDRDVATYLIENFKRESDFLEHIVSEYPNFLPPDLMYSMMEIEDGLDDIVDAIWVVSMLTRSKDGNYEPRLRDAIHDITKEICHLIEKDSISSSSSNQPTLLLLQTGTKDAQHE
jgi:hypothetical protein